MAARAVLTVEQVLDELDNDEDRFNVNWPVVLLSVLLLQLCWCKSEAMLF